MIGGNSANLMINARVDNTNLLDSHAVCISIFLLSLLWLYKAPQTLTQRRTPSQAGSEPSPNTMPVCSMPILTRKRFAIAAHHCIDDGKCDLHHGFCKYQRILGPQESLTWSARSSDPCSWRGSQRSSRLLIELLIKYDPALYACHV